MIVLRANQEMFIYSNEQKFDEVSVGISGTITRIQTKQEVLQFFNYQISDIIPSCKSPLDY